MRIQTFKIERAQFAVLDIPYDQVRSAVIKGLSREGKAIDDIVNVLKYKGDLAQREFGSNPVWHTKKELDYFVAKTLKLDAEAVLGKNKKSSDFSTSITREIVKLRKRGVISDWQNGKRIGVWRVTGDLYKESASMHGMSSAERSNAEQTGNEEIGYDDLRRAFISILRRGRKDNTYKFALARALLEYCRSNRDVGTRDIKYDYLADKFLEYYWRQECLFKIKQDFHTSKSPRVIQAIREVWKDASPGSFSLAKAADKKRAKEMILHDVFGHARSKTSLVVPKFQKLSVGSRAKESRIFYDYDDDEKRIVLTREAFNFFSENYEILKSVVLVEWTRFLERTNDMPKLMTKIYSNTAQRVPNIRYRKALEAHFDHCFYCCSTLKDSAHVDHFIPWSYIYSDDMWNFVLACSSCNCKKSASVPEEKFLGYLIERNGRYEDRIEYLRRSLDKLSRNKRGWEDGIRSHYHACQEYGFGTWPDPNLIRV